MHKSHAGLKTRHTSDSGDDHVDPTHLMLPGDLLELDESQSKAIALAELEFGMASVSHAFQRWIVCCMTAAQLKDLSIVDVLVLHHVNHRVSNKRLADICFILNIEDAHVVGYSLRKLIALGVVKAEKHGKEVTYSTTPPGQDYLLEYQKIREQHLLGSLKTLGVEDTALGHLAQFLRRMSGLYDQAARAASSL
jgi:predicted MarR family transcription regulator